MTREMYFDPLKFPPSFCYHDKVSVGKYTKRASQTKRPVFSALSLRNEYVQKNSEKIINTIFSLLKLPRYVVCDYYEPI